MSNPQQPGDYSFVDDYFEGGGKSLHFDTDKGYTIGQWKGGVILEIKPKKQQTDMKTRALLTYDDGSPRWSLPITLQTDERDPADPYDDGKRTAYLDGGKERAVRDMVKATRAKIRPGGVLMLAWTSGAGKIGDPKQYSARYTPAEHAAADAMFAVAPGAAPAQTPAPAAPVAAIPAVEVPYPPYLSPEQVAGLQAAGIAPQQAWQMFPAPTA